MAGYEALLFCAQGSSLCRMCMFSGASILCGMASVCAFFVWLYIVFIGAGLYKRLCSCAMFLGANSLQ
jgi:hypothetical protein